MTDYRSISDRECLRRYYEDDDEEAFEVLFQRIAPLVLASLRRFSRARRDPLGLATSGIEPEDALQHAFAQLLARRFELGDPVNVARWLYTIGRNYMIDPWRPRRVAARLFELWPGPYPGRATRMDTDWLDGYLAEGLNSTMGQQEATPEDCQLRALDDVEWARRLDEFRQHRDRWLTRNAVYTRVIDMISADIQRNRIGPALGAEEAETLLRVLRQSR